MRGGERRGAHRLRSHPPIIHTWAEDIRDWTRLKGMYGLQVGLVGRRRVALAAESLSGEVLLLLLLLLVPPAAAFAVCFRSVLWQRLGIERRTCGTGKLRFSTIRYLPRMNLVQLSLLLQFYALVCSMHFWVLSVWTRIILTCLPCLPWLTCLIILPLR